MYNQRYLFPLKSKGEATKHLFLSRIIILLFCFVSVSRFNCLRFLCSHTFGFSVSGSNLATHIVGSLKKGKSLTPIPPTTYNTLPSSHTLSHARTQSDGMISPSPNLSLPPAHKRSPSSDSGNAGSRSNTPVSYHMGKIHTAFLHGELSLVFLC